MRLALGAAIFGATMAVTTLPAIVSESQLFSRFHAFFSAVLELVNERDAERAVRIESAGVVFGVIGSSRSRRYLLSARRSSPT